MLAITFVEEPTVPAARTPSVVLSAIQAWPHWEEIGKVAKKEYGVEEEQFKALLPEYQQFMGLIIVGYHGLGMFSADIDRIWHSHILSTHRYQDFCESLHGQFIHHIPQLTPKQKGQCSVCQSCRGCNTKCENCQGNPNINDTSDSIEYFNSAYLASYEHLPPSIWGLDESDGISG